MMQDLCNFDALKIYVKHILTSCAEIHVFKAYEVALFESHVATAAGAVAASRFRSSWQPSVERFREIRNLAGLLELAARVML